MAWKPVPGFTDLYRSYAKDDWGWKKSWLMSNSEYTRR